MAVPEHEHAYEHKTIVRRLFDDVINARNLDLAERFIAPNMVDHTNFPGLPEGLAGLKQLLGLWFPAFPDSHFTIDDMVAERDRVVVRWTVQRSHQREFLGISTTGKSITMSGIDEVRLAFGQIVEHWGMLDLLDLLRQLGAVHCPPERTD
jgi:predicted ester cyclase